MINVDYWADFTCPFSYIGYNNLRQALKDLNIDANMIMHAYELNPDMPDNIWESSTRQLMEKDGMTKEEAQEQIQWLNNYAHESDLPMSFGDVHFCNTQNAHRLVKYVQSLDLKKADELVYKLFRGNFVEGKILSDPQVLLEYIRELGLDEKEAARILESEEYLEDIRQEEKQAERIPIETIPYFDVDGLIIPTSMSLTDYKTKLKENDIH